LPYAHNDDNEIYYETTGQGPAILFVSGFGADHAVWCRQKAAFASSHTVITFDNRGIGKSTSRKDGYSIADMASDALAVLRAALGNRDEMADLVGVSMGGMIAAALAAAEPQIVRGLFLISSSLIPNVSTEAALASAMNVLDRDGSAAFVRAMSAIVFTPEFTEKHARDLAAIKRAWEPPEGSPPEVRRQFEAIVNFAGVPRGAMRCRVGAIAGRDDRLIPLEVMEQTAQMVGAQLQVVEGVGHGLLVERPDVINNVLKLFLSQLSQNPRFL